MTNPEPFFAPDFFGTRDVTLNRLQKFSLDFILRLGLDNPDGVFTPLITDLTKRHTALFGSMQAADAGTAQRRGSAQLMWGALADLQDQLEEDEDLINYKAKKKPGIRTDFFPNNREEYSDATLLTADLLFARAEKAAQTHAQALGEDFDANKYVGFYKAFKEARKLTGEGDEQTDKARAEAKNQRDDLTEHLTDGMKLIAAQFLRDEARCRSFMRLELLTRGEAAEQSAEQA